MFISYKWLGRHVDLTGISPTELARDLTLQTAEVEGVEPFAPALSQVVVGHVLEREPHPDADKLGICKVDLGPGPDGMPSEPAQIVCGAPNVAAGQLVAVARIGTTLPVAGGEEGETLKIKKAKIRGVESRGMICSERELGLGEEHDGIWVLPFLPGTHADLIGTPVAEALGGVEGQLDWIIEIDNKSLTHRPDLWGHRGLASEVAAIRGLELKPIATDLPPTGDAAPLPIRVESDGCSRYIGLAIDGLENGRSPDWMRHLLLAVGQRPLDLFVDISNFVMLDLGQPNHLFDRTALAADGILVRDAKPGESMTTLDGTERKLDPRDILITSGGEAVALAGVMGGEQSKVQEGTTSMLLELATFEPTRIRLTGQRLGLRTDSSARFEKHLDPTLPLKAAAHLVALLGTLQPNMSLPSPPAEDGSWTDPACEVHLRPARCRAILGLDDTQLPDERIAQTLTSLGFGVLQNGDDWTVAVPSARATKDVGIEEDLIEEVGRIYRYDHIPEQRLIAELIPMERDERRHLVRCIQDRLAGSAAFHETMAHSFLADGLCRALGIADDAFVRVKNPVAEGYERIRRSVVPSLVNLVAPNLRHASELRFFEVGKGYCPEFPTGDHAEPAELHEAGLLLARAGARSSEPSAFGGTSLFGLKAAVEDLLVHLERARPDRGGVPGIAWTRPEPEDGLPVFAHPGKAMIARATNAKGKAFGPALAWLAELEPGVAPAPRGGGGGGPLLANGAGSIEARVVAQPPPRG
ncbi:MAG: phenylalanine--tRNA ligase subunit beta, partial [Planctomycetota bacterium]|nr:phenylalanine--tRNA ligase subunit beta [Planctomycetota bacterium]